MKATFTFNLPEEGELFDIYQQAQELNAAVREFDNRLKTSSKHLNDEHAARWRETLWSILTEYGIELD